MINVYDFLKFRPELYKQFTCKDILIAYYDCPQETQTVDVLSYHNIFSFVISGKKRFYKAGKSWLFMEGDALLIKKGAFHQEIYLGEGYRAINFYVSENYLRQIINTYNTINKCKSLLNEPTEQIIQFQVGEATQCSLRDFLSFFSQQIPPLEELLEEKIGELIFSMMANPTNPALISYFNSITDQPKTSLFEVMELNYMYNLLLSDYARISNRSLTTFKRDFKTLFNLPPAKWLIEKRLSYGRLLLETTPKSINDISFESGFESNAHFSRKFKEKFGLSPFHYRRDQLTSAVA